MRADGTKLHVKELKEKELIQSTEVHGTIKATVTSKGPASASLAEVGDVVIIRKQAGARFKFEGEDYLLINESEIFGIL